MMDTDLVVIGCGAAGLMAAVTAGELGLKCVALERRHRVGLKLLMCGNNRCNISHAFNVEQMLAAYGEPVESFLRSAITQFAPQTLCRWFSRNGLATCIKNERVYPTTENGDDVLHCFTDRMRDLAVPLMLNCPVVRLEPLDGGGYRVVCEKLSLTARKVLLATGGVSYPKTGSVGDGQRMLTDLGVEVTPLRAGLAGVDVNDNWLQCNDKCEFLNVKATVSDDHGVFGVTSGNMLCEGGTLRGTAIFDATRLIAHRQPKSFGITLDLIPQMGTAFADAALKKRGGLKSLGIPEPLVLALERQLPKDSAGQWLKALPLEVKCIRPLKEAIVTVGGVALSEVNPQTMELFKLSGIYVTGELLDVDGPTGGFNLHAAFATAHLAVRAIAETLGVMDKSRIFVKEAPRDVMSSDRGGGRGGQGRRAFDGGKMENGERTAGWKSKNAQGAPMGKDASKIDRGKHAPAHARSRADSRPGNRWDNSEFERKRTRPSDGITRNRETN